MIFSEYKEIYDHAPYTLEEFAEGAEEVEDNPALADAAKQFIRAKIIFENVLEDASIEMG